MTDTPTPPARRPAHVRVQNWVRHRWRNFKLRAIVTARLATSRQRLLPDYLIIGAPKCGTSAMQVFLANHPQVLPALRKEVYYFDQTYARGLSWYRAFFPTESAKQQVERSTGRAVVGEATPSYLIHPLAPRRAFETVPDARLIVMLRNPVDRAYSLHQQSLARGRETLPFEAAVAAEQERFAQHREAIAADPDAYALLLRHRSYFTGSLYMDQLERWLAHFPRERLHVIIQEEFRARPSEVFHELLEFLGIQAWEPPEYRKVHQRAYDPLDAATRARMLEQFRPHNQRLFEFLGREISWE